jgi:DNA replication initiation complex subunit (GINS family)
MIAEEAKVKADEYYAEQEQFNISFEALLSDIDNFIEAEREKIHKRYNRVQYKKRKKWPTPSLKYTVQIVPEQPVAKKIANKVVFVL